MASRRISAFTLCLMVVLAMGCGQGSDDGEEGPASVSRGDVADHPPFTGLVVVNDMDAATDRWGSDAFDLEIQGDDAPAIEGDTLTLTVSYAGGCRRHDFTLVSDLEFREEADHVHLGVSLAHDANGDPCEAYPTEAYAFDLSPIKTLYRETYGNDDGPVTLRLQGYRPDDVGELVYNLDDLS